MADKQTEAIEERPEKVVECPNLAMSLKQAVKEMEVLGVPVKDTKCKNIDPGTTSAAVEYLRSDSPIPNTVKPEYSSCYVEKWIAEVAEKIQMKSKLNPNAPVFSPVGLVLEAGRTYPKGDICEVVEKLNPNAPTFHPTSSHSSSTKSYDNNNNKVPSPLPGSDIERESFKN